MVPSVKLANGAKMPMIGLGTWQSKPNEVRDAVDYALDIGYRHIDTAFAYGNEHEIGEILNKKISEGKLKREDVFVTTKLWNTFHHPDRVLQGVRQSLDNLGLDYVDLYLIHTPAGFKHTGDDKVLLPKNENGKPIYERTDHVLIWKELEKAVDRGWVKAIGLSNFNRRQIQYILDNCRIKPVNLQVEGHAYFMQNPLFDFCKQNDISFTCYASLGSPARPFAKPGEPVLLDEPVVKEIALNHGKTAAQVLNRFLIDKGRIVIPKSVSPARIKENFDLFDYELTKEEVEKLEGLDRNLRYFMFDIIEDSEDNPLRDAC